MEGTKPPEEPCAEYLRSIAEQLGADFEGEGKSAKTKFIKDIRARVAQRRPARA